MHRPVQQRNPRPGSWRPLTAMPRMQDPAWCPCPLLVTVNEILEKLEPLFLIKTFFWDLYFEKSNATDRLIQNPRGKFLLLRGYEIWNHFMGIYQDFTGIKGFYAIFYPSPESVLYCIIFQWSPYLAFGDFLEFTWFAFILFFISQLAQSFSCILQFFP